MITSIIIPLFNKVDYTRACLDALYKNSGPKKHFEVIAVDNGSRDKTPRLLKETARKYPSFHVVTNKKNRGFAAACNNGAEVSKGKYLVFLNNDTEPQPGWLSGLTKVMEKDESIAAAGSKLLFPNGTIQHAGVAIVKNLITDSFPGFTHIYYEQPGTLEEANRKKIYQVLSAACLMVREEKFREVGGFDEGYWNGCEDIDLCLKIGEKGGKLVYVPGSVVIHHEFGSGTERFSKGSRNRERLMEKWGNRVIPDYIRKPRNPYMLNPHSPVTAHFRGGEWEKKLLLKYLPPDYVSAEYFLLGQAVSPGDLKTREYFFQNVLKLLLARERKTPMECYRIASSYKQLRRFNKSVVWFRKVVAETEDVSLVSGSYFHMGEIELLQGKIKKAVEFFKQTKALNPNHQKAREYLDANKKILRKKNAQNIDHNTLLQIREVCETVRRRTKKSYDISHP
jgi:GT2 family glycosyltransferase